MREIELFSGKIYTAGTNFTRPPFVTVATNLNSVAMILTSGTETRTYGAETVLSIKREADGSRLAAGNTSLVITRRGLGNFLVGMSKSIGSTED